MKAESFTNLDLLFKNEILESSPYDLENSNTFESFLNELISGLLATAKVFYTLLFFWMGSNFLLLLLYIDSFSNESPYLSLSLDFLPSDLTDSPIESYIS